MNREVIHICREKKFSVEIYSTTILEKERGLYSRERDL